MSDSSDGFAAQESAAFTEARRLAGTFGWSMTITTRSDVETVLDRDLTDFEWDRVRTSSPWQDGVTNNDWSEDVLALTRALGIKEGD